MSKPSTAIAACASLGLGTVAIAQPSFERLGTYTTGLAVVAPEITAAETAALRDGKLYVSNAFDVSLDIVDVSNPAAPVLIERVDLFDYGAQVNSVAVSSANLIAVAVEAPVKTDKGKVVFLTPDGTIIGVAKVGSLPDMVVFTPDGSKLLVANEAEPSCYGAPGCVDPKGTVSIITVSPWKQEPTVKTVEFDKVAIPSNVRIFGPNAKANEDLEPEYIAITPDSRTAYVTLQENNAIAEVNIQNAQVTAIRGLGYKDMNLAPTTQVFEIDGLPPIGPTAAGQPIALGGFSSLFYEGRTPGGKLKFVTNTDRGPNGEPIPMATGDLRPFLLPDFVPRIVRLELDPATGDVAITQQITLKRSDGVTPLTGRPNTEIGGGGPNTPYDDEVPIDLFGTVLTLDPLGGDFEGIVVDATGTFWLCDEYRPAIYRFAANGTLLARYIPIGTHAAAGVPYIPGTAGLYGTEVLPAVLGQRRQNRGMEGIAIEGGLIYAFVQSPIRNPPTLSNGTLNGLTNVRIVELNPTTLATRQFLYQMDNEAASGTNSRADKIGDAVALPGRGFLVLERDDDAVPGDPVADIRKRIYAFNLIGATAPTTATPITPANDILYNGKRLDEMTAAELATAGIRPVTKVLHLDLASTAYNTVQKIEGLAVVDADTIALVNDNDFRVAAININNTTGTFTLAPGYVPEPELLALIDTGGFDASDRDNVINIRNWPVYGMYMPDGIATYTAGGQRLLVTANEGDARAYTGFSEEATVGDLAAMFPGFPLATWQLGRLAITNTPPLADFSRPYMFGTRSFSIWNAATGAQVWDSGSDLEVRTAGALVSNFNSNNTANNFDNRSDNKGPEPEGVDIGQIDGHSYAFVALERVGGVAVYDVTVPTAPTFVQYFNDRSFSGAIGPDSGPEVVKFIPASESPSGSPLVIVANEISGTVSLWGLAD